MGFFKKMRLVGTLGYKVTVVGSQRALRGSDWPPVTMQYVCRPTVEHRKKRSTPRKRWVRGPTL